jgi:hypothetical protein
MADSESESESESEQDPARPLLRVVRGEPTAEELAALVAVLAGRTPAAPPSQPRQSPWTDRREQLSRPVFIGPGEWRRAGFEKGTRTKADW